MELDRAVALVNGWIKEYHGYLKDGGGAQGVHAKAKAALIEKIRVALCESKPVVRARQTAQSPSADGTPVAPRKKKAAKPSEAAS